MLQSSSSSDVSVSDSRKVAESRSIKLSILMPSYNEDATVVTAINAILDQNYPCPIELIICDDGSRTPVKDLIADLLDPRVRIIRHETNLGKGAALRQAAAIATGTHMVPFDADLEYDPADLVSMLAPVIAGRTDLVYGTRLFGVNTRFQSYRHGRANKFLTTVANLAFNVYLNDLHTCLKLMPLDLFRSFPLTESGFGLDTEITARILRDGHRPFEVPVSYHSRSKADGKKITWRDGVDCLTILARIRAGSVGDALLDNVTPAPVTVPSRARTKRRSSRFDQTPTRLRIVNPGLSESDDDDLEARVAVR